MTEALNELLLVQDLLLVKESDDLPNWPWFI
jgi:hypothetical protein